MKMNWLFGLIFGLCLVCPSLAVWSCGGSNYDDCSGTYSKNCCVNGIATCLKSSQDCSEYCCDSGCNSWDEFWFCNVGYTANCMGDKEDMVCCLDSSPIWHSETNSCWGTDWECVSSSECPSRSPIGDLYCKEDMVVQDYEIYSCSNHKCVLGTQDSWVKTCEFGCENGVCLEEGGSGGGNNWIYVVLLVVIVAFLGVLYWVLKR